MEKSNYKISVIVAVYNAEDYLCNCCNSILAQTYRNIELILVNDGSEDNSLAICKKIQASDKRVVVIDKENGGCYSAWNKGLDVATGDFIGFVDNDDYIQPQMYETLLDILIEQDADICAFGILFIVWGHVLRSGQFRMYLYTFNVTLFFFLLGYTFKCDESLKEFFKKRFLRTMIPYYIWSVVSILIFLLMGKYVSFDVSNASMSLWKNLIGMLYANSRTIYMRWNLPLWFIPCMNLTLVLVWLLERVRQDTVKTNRVKCRAVFCLILILVGLVIQKKLTDIKFPFQFESAVLMAAFVELGLIFKECKIVERVNKDDLYILVCALLLGTGLFFSKINGVAEVRSSNYGKYPILFVITACAMTGFVVLISYKIGGNFILEKLGQSSLPILLMHKFPILFFQSVLPKTKFLLEKPDTIDGFLCSFVVTCVSIGICYMGKNIIRSVMPIIIGE